MSPLVPHSTPADAGPGVIEFIKGTEFNSLPQEVVAQAVRCVFDQLGVAAGATATDMSRIARDYAATELLCAGSGARLCFDGRRSSAAGCALAGGVTIDSLDAHDGHALTKGHAGAAVLPAMLAYAEACNLTSGREFLSGIVVGYEIATRAGIALHATVHEHHSSGAWNALGCAALGARYIGLNASQTREALGIAEYHGPRSQMMRVIDHPTMVRDGSGWGALIGVQAAQLARAGFTGAPALTIEVPDVAEYWSDLGSRWRILEQYFKPYPVCRWAQPAVEAALTLKTQHAVSHADIAQVEVFSFYQAVRLATRTPESTVDAQYSTPNAVAAAIVRGSLGVSEVTAPCLEDRTVLRLSNSMVLTESQNYSRKFPAERWAVLQSAPATARGDPNDPLSDDEIEAKYRSFAAPVIGDRRSERLLKLVNGLSDLDSRLAEFIDAALRRQPASRSPVRLPTIPVYKITR